MLSEEKRIRTRADLRRFHSVEMKKVSSILLLCQENISGGAERVLSLLANEFCKRGIDTYFLTFDSVSDFYPLDPKVNLVRLHIGTNGMSGTRKMINLPRVEYLRWKRMLRQIKQINPDVVISFLFMSMVFGWICCRQLHKSFVVSERADPNHWSLRNKLTRDYIYRRVDGYVSQSDTIKRFAERQYGLTNVVTIPNPLTPSQVAEPAKEKKNVILSVGRLNRQKNHSLLIDAFSKIQSKYPDYQIHIYGKGALREELEEKIRQCGMEGKVILCGVERDAIKIHNDAKLFVLSSNFEGYPNVLVEAMANGIASISTDFATGSARDIIENGENGLLVPTQDVDALAKAMDAVLSDDNLRKKMETNGLKIFAKTEISIIADKWLDYLNEVVNNSTK